MDKEQFKIMKNKKGFIAALDQSGGSTPKALKNYGIGEDQYDSEDKMFDLVHKMRTRIITSSGFTSDHILAAIIFERTMDSKIQGMWTADFLWDVKGIVPILKVDRGLAELKDGVQLMNPMNDLDSLLNRAIERNIFGTKMRSVIKEANPEGIKEIVAQQFEYGKKIIEKGLVPILEPEVDINSKDKEEIEDIMNEEILKHLDELSKDEFIMLKLTIPSKEKLFSKMMKHPQVIRVAALSGGYSREYAVEGLRRNPGLIASFSRALLEGLSVDQTDKEFNNILSKSVETVFAGSIV